MLLSLLIGLAGASSTAADYGKLDPEALTELFVKEKLGSNEAAEALTHEALAARLAKHFGEIKKEKGEGASEPVLEEGKPLGPPKEPSDTESEELKIKDLDAFKAFIKAQKIHQIGEEYVSAHPNFTTIKTQAGDWEEEAKRLEEEHTKLENEYNAFLTACLDAFPNGSDDLYKALSASSNPDITKRSDAFMVKETPQQKADRLKKEEDARIEAARIEADRLKKEEADRLKKEEADRLKKEEDARIEAARIEAAKEAQRILTQKEATVGAAAAKVLIQAATDKGIDLDEPLSKESIDALSSIRDSIPVDPKLNTKKDKDSARAGILKSFLEYAEAKANFNSLSQKKPEGGISQ